ncbi:MAG: M14 family metallopeptidase [Chthonomonadales bacterium]
MFLFPALLHFASVTPTQIPADLKLLYERSGGMATGRYSEAVDFCRKLEKLSPMAHVMQFGTSPQGRPMIALILSRDKEFTASAVSYSKKPLIFINNGIHSGEIEGKDASLILARDILVSKKHTELLDHLNILIVPVFSVDAHERFNQFHRINQNGPVEMGWRSTATNLNLNRDFTKADAPEMRAMLKLLQSYKPDFFFDNHTTDGGDWQYSIQYQASTGPEVDYTVAAWTAGMIKAMQPKVEKDGFLMAPYFGGVNAANPKSGISVDTFTPRYSTGYISAMGRACMLVETHMLKPYKHRVEATYSIVLRTLEYCNKDWYKLRCAGERADAWDSVLRITMSGANSFSYALTTRLSRESRPFVFRGYKYNPFKSDVSGASTHAWIHENVDTETTIQDQFVPALYVSVPAAFVIPAEWADVIEIMRLHGFQMERMTADRTIEVRSTAFADVRFPQAPFEGRFQPSFKETTKSEKRLLPKGSVVIETSQPGLRLLLHLLEPSAPDSLVKWGLFNSIFEQKEYFEDYSMEPIARKMLETNPALKAEFEEKLKDPAFAGNSRARLEWFFVRSPYNDERLNRYPVVRLEQTKDVEAVLK